MSFDWKEIYKKKPCDLFLHSDDISEQLDSANGDIDETLYRMKYLKLLDITNVPSLKVISPKVSNLRDLTHLILRSTGLTEIPGLFCLHILH